MTIARRVTTVMARAAAFGSSSSIRTEQPKRAANFDGTNDLIDYGSGLIAAGDFSISARVYIPALPGSVGLFGMGDTFDTGYGCSAYVNSSGTIYAVLVAGGTRVFAQKTGLTAAAWHHIVVTVNRAGNMTVYLNGVAGTPVSVTGVSGSIANGSFFAGRYGNSSTYFTGRMFDLQIIPAALTAAQVIELRDNSSAALSGTTRTLWSKLDEQHPTLAYDSSGDEHHGTITGHSATVGGFFYEGFDVPFSYQNNVGYTKSGSVYVPRDESDVTNDVDGNPLQFAGPFS